MTTIQNAQEEQLILAMRYLDESRRATLLKTMEQLIEEEEDAEDLRIAAGREHEVGIPAEEVYKRLGL